MKHWIKTENITGVNNEVKIEAHETHFSTCYMRLDFHLVVDLLMSFVQYPTFHPRTGVGRMGTFKIFPIYRVALKLAD